MEDADCRDQYSVIYDSGERTGIFANDVKEPIEVEERAVSWSSIYLKFETMCPVRLCDVYSVVLLCVCCSAGPRHMSGGLQKAPIWPPSTREASLCGAVRSSSRSRDLVIKGFNLSISLPVRGTSSICTHLFGLSGVIGKH